MLGADLEIDVGIAVAPRVACDFVDEVPGEANRSPHAEAAFDHLPPAVRLDPVLDLQIEAGVWILRQRLDLADVFLRQSGDGLGIETLGTGNDPHTQQMRIGGGDLRQVLQGIVAAIEDEPTAPVDFQCELHDRLLFSCANFWGEYTSMATYSQYWDRNGLNFAC